MFRYFKRNEKGFTLIELLIVVAIIGILAAIAIPNLITAQARARYSRSAGDTKSIVTQAMVVTSDYNQTPNGGLGFAMDPSFLWSQPNGPLGTPIPVYMAQVQDPWAPGTPCINGGAGQACYQFLESVGTGCGLIGPGCVIFSARTVGSDATVPGTAWPGTAGTVPSDNDLGVSSVVGCQFGPNVTISNPC